MVSTTLRTFLLSSTLCFSATAMADWPVAMTDNRAVHPEIDLTGIDVLANDTGDGLKVIAVNAWSENGARVSVIREQVVTYRPPVGYEGEDGFWYAIQDSEGRTNAARVSVNVLSASSPLPAPQEDSVQTPKDTPIRIDVLRNDLFTQGIASGGLNNGGSITWFSEWSINGGTIEKIAVYDDIGSPQLINQLRYTPPPGFVGTDTFEYTIKDTNSIEAGTVEQTTKVTVEVLKNTNISTPYPAGNPDTVSFQCVVGGCTERIYVVDNDEGKNLRLLLNSAWSLKGGQVKVLPNNVFLPSINYTPPISFSGEDKVWYVIEDEFGRKNWSVLTINVTRP